MWSGEQIGDDLKELGLPAGVCVLVHASMRAVGKVTNGAAGFVEALQAVVGPDGVIMAPTFTPQFRDPDEWTNPPETEEARDSIRSQLTCFDVQSTPADLPRMGILCEVLRTMPNALRSDHPTHSFAAIGSPAATLTQNAPFHLPLGTDSPLARLHNLDGWVLLVGVGHEVNSSIHLAEVWANAPFVHRAARVKTAPGTWSVMQGSPECSDGFTKIEMVLRQGRLLRRGYVGNAPCQLVKMRELVSMAIAMIQGDAESLLCDRPSCRWCTLARTFTKAGC